MPHYFFDTSALVKHYHIEPGSPRVDQILAEPGSIYFIARLTMTELLSVFAKKVRIREIAGVDFDGLRLRLYSHVQNQTLRPVRMLNGHFESAGNLIAKHGKTRQLHTLDALQLAAALSIQRPTAIDHFVCADQSLCEIALLEGLTVINPEQP
jgi:predicted nucleic acid-binding protein